MADQYEVVPFRPGKSTRPECGSEILHLRPVVKLPTLITNLESFFICTKCDYVGQVGETKLWPRTDNG